MKHLCFIHVAAIALAGFEENFWIGNSTTSQGLPYDFSSIMHFRHNAFSCDNHKSTVVPHSPRIPKTFLGNSATATDLDFLHLNILYCRGTCTDVTFLHVHSYMVKYFLQVHASRMHVYIYYTFKHEQETIHLNKALKCHKISVHVYIPYMW